MEVMARAAAAPDLDVLSELAVEAVEELTPNRGGAVWRRERARALPPLESLRSDLGDENCRICVGCIDDVPIGYGVLRVDALRDGGLLGRISDLYTLPGARGVGVGEAMMDHLLGFASERDCFGVDSIALPGDRHTKNFFESFGLVARELVVHRTLGHQ